MFQKVDERFGLWELLINFVSVFKVLFFNCEYYLRYRFVTFDLSVELKRSDLREKVLTSALLSRPILEGFVLK